MGWVWRDEDGDSDFSLSGDGQKLGRPNTNISGDQCSIRKVVNSQCKTEEVTPGKFVRKCEKTEEILRDCIGRPVELIQSTKEYTEEEVTNEVQKGSFSMGSPEGGGLDFPGLRRDIEAIERSLFGGFNRFFVAADEMKNGFFNVLRDPHLFEEEPYSSSSSSSSSSARRKIPVEDRPQTKPDSGSIDLAGLARDV